MMLGTFLTCWPSRHVLVLSVFLTAENLSHTQHLSLLFGLMLFCCLDVLYFWPCIADKLM